MLLFLYTIKRLKIIKEYNYEDAFKQNTTAHL